MAKNTQKRSQNFVENGHGRLWRMTALASAALQETTHVIRKHPTVLVWPLIALAMLLGFGVWGVTHIAGLETRSAKAHAASLALDTAVWIRSQIAASSTPSQLIGAVVHIDPQYEAVKTTFGSLAPVLLAQAPNNLTRSLQLVPNGVIDCTFPEAGNEKAQGLNVFESTKVGDRDGSLKAVRDRVTTLVGPMAIVQGGNGLIIRTPVFITGVDAEETFGFPVPRNRYCGDLCNYNATDRSLFWGFVASLIDLNVLSEAADSRLRTLERMGYRYQVMALGIALSDMRVIAASRTPPANPVEAIVALPNSEWVVRLSPDDGWRPSYYSGLLAVTVVISIAMAALLFAALVSKMRHKMLLEALVSKKVLRNLKNSDAPSSLSSTRRYDPDTPADLLLSMMGELLEGRIPNLRDVLFIRTVLVGNMDIYRPLNLRCDIKEANLDADVTQALMRQLIGAGNDAPHDLDDMPKKAKKEACAPMPLSSLVPPMDTPAGALAFILSEPTTRSAETISLRARHPEDAAPVLRQTRPRPCSSGPKALQLTARVSGIRAAGCDDREDAGKSLSITYTNDCDVSNHLPCDHALLMLAAKDEPCVRGGGLQRQRSRASSWFGGTASARAISPNRSGGRMGGLLGVRRLASNERRSAAGDTRFSRKSSPRQHPETSRPSPQCRAEPMVQQKDTMENANAGDCDVGASGPVVRSPMCLQEAERLLSQADGWQFDTWALQEATQGHGLSALGFYLMQRAGLVTRLHLDPVKWARLLRQIEAGYVDNPYHNAVHAADVLQTLHVIIHAAQLHVHYLDPLGLLAAYYSAIVHDFAHPGLTSDFLIATSDPLAVRYNDRSPLENHHCAASFSLLQRPGLDALAPLSAAERAAFRKQVIDLVLATDMKQHFSILSHFNTVHRLGSYLPQQPGQNSDCGPERRCSRKLGCDAQLTEVVVDAAKSPPQEAPTPVDDTERLLSLQVALKVADIGHLGEALDVHQRWLRVLEEEFFRQGDRERALGLPISPLFDRAKQGVSKSQVGFYDFVALPLVHAVSSAFPSLQPLMKCFLSNYRHWKDSEAAVLDAAT